MTAQFQFFQSLPHKKADFVKKKPAEHGVIHDCLWQDSHLLSSKKEFIFLSLVLTADLAITLQKSQKETIFVLESYLIFPSEPVQGACMSDLHV